MVPGAYSVRWGTARGLPLPETEYSNMPLALRARAYRGLAADTRREARRCKGFARDAYLMIAEQWERLAADIESYLAAQEAEAAGENAAAPGRGAIADPGSQIVSEQREKS